MANKTGNAGKYRGNFSLKTGVYWWEPTIAFVVLLIVFVLFFMAFAASGKNLFFALIIDVFVGIPYIFISLLNSAAAGPIGLLYLTLLVGGYVLFCIWLYRFFPKSKFGRKFSSAIKPSSSRGSSSRSGGNFTGGGGRFGGGGASGKW